MNKILCAFTLLTFTINCFAQTAKDTTVHLLFVGDGAIQKSFSAGEEIPANAGLGIVFIKNYNSSKSIFKINRLELEAIINIASTVDTIKADVIDNNVKNRRSFGNFITNPFLTGQSASLSAIGYRDYTDQKKLSQFVLGDGYTMKFAASNRLWYLNPDSSANCTSLYARVSSFWEFIPNDDLNEYSVRFSLFSFSFREILGDITQDDNEQLRIKLIGSNHTFFFGWEPFFAIKLKNLKAEITLPFLFTTEDVRAVNGGQFSTSIGFSGGFALAIGQKGQSTTNTERDR